MARRPVLQSLIDRFIPEIRDAFLQAIQGVVDAVLLDRLIEAIKQGDVNGAFGLLSIDDAAMRPITATLERAFEAGGVLTTDGFPKRLNTSSGAAVIRFDVRNARAEKWIREQSSQLVTRVADDTRTALRNVMTERLAAGSGPRNTALDIVGRIDPVTKRRTGGIVGLTVPQERAVSNMRKDLDALDERYFTRERRDKRFDRTVRKAIDNGKKLDNETISKLTGRYKDNLLELRGTTIARTEAIQALNRSDYEATMQAVDQGAIKRKYVQRVWDSAGDDGRTRDTHLAMDGQTIGLDEPFISPSGARLMFPGDTSLGAPGEETISCRCRVRMKIDWIAGAKDGDAVKPVAPIVPKVDTKKLDATAKNNVVDHGLKTGKEALEAYDEATGQLFKNTGTSNTVAFTDEMLAVFSDPKRAIIAHHNHPLSASFSGQDIDMLVQFPGIKGIWAHGHNGSSFYVERGTKPMVDHKQVSSDLRNATIKEIGFVSSSEMARDLSLLHNHYVWQTLHEKEILRYTAELKAESQTALKKYSETFSKVRKKLWNM